MGKILAIVDLYLWLITIVIVDNLPSIFIVIVTDWFIIVVDWFIIVVDWYIIVIAIVFSDLLIIIMIIIVYFSSIII